MHFITNNRTEYFLKKSKGTEHIFVIFIKTHKTVTNTPNYRWQNPLTPVQDLTHSHSVEVQKRTA